MAKRYKLYLSLLILIFSAACGEHAPQRDCDIKSLILNKSFFHVNPEMVSDFNFESPVHEAPPESAGFSFYLKNDFSSDLVSNEVFRYRYLSQAKEMYNTLVYNTFGTNEGVSQRDVLSALSALQIHADQFRLGCGIDECNLFARYQEYYVSFKMEISENGMTVHDFSNAVSEIDKLMIACVDK
jgi:hypothetical protein